MTERSVERSVQRDDTTVRPVRQRGGAASTATPTAPVIPPSPAEAPAAPAPEVKAPKPPKPVKPSKPSRSERKATAAAANRPSRKARLRLTRVDPWSIMKTSFLLSIAFGIVTIVAVFMVWSVLGAAGVWDSVNDAVRNVIGGQDAKDFDITDYLGTQRIVGFTMIVAVVDVVLITAIATLSAFLYNMSAALLGGVEVTLAEDS